MIAPLLLATAAAVAPVTVPPQPQLTEQIKAADAALFKLFFEGPCDSARFRAMISDDVEFYHDKGGFNVRKPADFVGQFEERCKALSDRAYNIKVSNGPTAAQYTVFSQQKVLQLLHALMEPIQTKELTGTYYR